MFDAHLDAGSVALLQQAYRNNWQQYLAALADSSRRRGWDLVVLTASNEQQAQAYQVQLAARRRAGLLPTDVEFRVVPDPAPNGRNGQRIGSGGATLRVLNLLASEHEPGQASGTLLAEKRVLMIHSGGDSRRLPHCSATGKLFARVPHELPDGRPSSLFDEFLVSLSGLPAQIPPGVLVASGDVLLLFDHLQLSFARPGVTGVGAAAPAATGTHHGVYVSSPASHQVRAFLHKPSLEQMQQEGALDEGGRAQIDTGLVWFDGTVLPRLLSLGEALAPAIARGVTVNLYGDLLAPLADKTSFSDYLADTSDGPATEEVQNVRRTVWSFMRGLPFSVERLHPALFVHFGTTSEYLQVMREGVKLLEDGGWSREAASWVEPSAASALQGRWVTVNAYLAGGHLDAVCALDSMVDADLTATGEGLVTHVVTRRQGLNLGPNTVIDQVPLRDGGFVTRLYGVADDPKRAAGVDGTWQNLPWRRWLGKAWLDAEDLWPVSEPPATRTLWNARLFVVADSREDSLDAALWLQDAESATEEQVTRWRTSRRLSLEESYLQADVERIVALDGEIEDRVRARRFYTGLERERPAEELRPLLGRTGDAQRRARLVADRLEASIDSWLPMRGYLALARSLDRAGSDHESDWEHRAFSSLARLIRAHTALGEPCEPDLATLPRQVTVRLPARIDFGGGWTDTPPYSLERGGAVLNAAIALRGERPILAQATFLDEPTLELESRDIEATMRPRLGGEVLNFANPADPFALLKAALVFRGVVPSDMDPSEPLSPLLAQRGFGLRLTTATSIPRGSGLGTSSILAGAILQALAQLLGQRDEAEGEAARQRRLFDEVLCLEQMITTGGGWQDQVGGLVDGIKLITTRPGLPQDIRVEPLCRTTTLRQAMDERLVIVYTGQRRLAKDLLRHVMGRWMARDPEMVAMLRDIARLAHEMHRALLHEDLDAFGELIAEHWEINKRMDPGCTNPFIDTLIASCQPFMMGAKLAGAGGGGFAIVIVHDAGAADALDQHLCERYPGGQVCIWPGHVT